MKTFLLLLSSLSLLTVGQVAAQSVPTSVGSYTTNTYPYAYVGKTTQTFSNGTYVGSATTVKAYTALTAGHCLYSGSAGWARSIKFETAKYYASVGSTVQATRMAVVGGYTTHAGSGGVNNSVGFSYDCGAFLCNSRPRNGGYAGLWPTYVGLTNTSYKMSLGYGSQYHDGQTLLKSAPSRTFTQSYGSFYTNYTYQIEAGMSGGPVFVYQNGGWYVCAVNVAGTSSMAGVRALDSSSTAVLNLFY